jgi:hypothetical protein
VNDSDLAILNCPKDYLSHKPTTISKDKSAILSQGDPKLCSSCEGLGNALESQNKEALNVY